FRSAVRMNLWVESLPVSIAAEEEINGAEEESATSWFF
ncbi:MAG: hypothetical protein JWO06_3627, partial [Bacteroidota bacterium]|nr:hypothetical protein [Bacteroidota bacterium]